MITRVGRSGHRLLELRDFPLSGKAAVHLIGSFITQYSSCQQPFVERVDTGIRTLRLR